MLSAGFWQVCGIRLEQASQTAKRDKKMKGLAITILLGILELAAAAASNNDLLTDGPPQLAAIRKEDGLQAEVLVDAERADLTEPEAVASSAEAI